MGFARWPLMSQGQIKDQWFAFGYFQDMNRIPFQVCCHSDFTEHLHVDCICTCRFSLNVSAKAVQSGKVQIAR